MKNLKSQRVFVLLRNMPLIHVTSRLRNDEKIEKIKGPVQESNLRF